MLVGTLELELRIDGSFSLKDKRRVIRSIIDRSRQLFKVSIAEVGDQDLWNSAVLGVAVASNDAHHAESMLTAVIEHVQFHTEAEIVSAVKKVERF